jgi:[acyl-carrier-protein] S-malonyltransferase
MFPGQSSRDAEMIERIVGRWPAARQIVDHASDVLGRALRKHYAAGQENAFKLNRDVQVGVFLTSYLHQRALADHGIAGDLSLGLSLGEYNHLVHIGALDFDDALRLVDARGRVYDAGPEGWMASVFPLPAEDLHPHIETAREYGAIEMANLNSPSQTVIAGAPAAVEAAARSIEDAETGVNVVVIERRIPMHTSLFRPVADALLPHLDAAPWRAPHLPYIPNVRAEMLTSPKPEDFRTALAQHVYSPVLWRRSIETVAAHYGDARFIEVGPGRVLYNLLQRSWLKNPRYHTDGPDSAARFATVAKEIADAA